MPFETSALKRRLQHALELAAADPKVPGALAVVHAPRLGLVWQGAARGAMCGPDEPWDSGLTFRIASVSKMHVAAAAMCLVEQGKLHLHRPLIECLSEPSAALLRNAGFDLRRITVSQLLTHTSGLPDHVAPSSYAEAVLAQPQRRWSRHEQIALAASMGGPLYAPGAASSYSDTGYVILGEVIELCAGLSIGPALRSLLDYQSLGLRDTYWEHQEIDPHGSRRARQWLGDVDATEFNPSFDLYGGGGLISTLDDLIRFNRALVHGRVFRQPGTLASAFMMPVAARVVDASQHGRVAMVLPMGSAWAWGHLGFWGCGVATCPDLNITVAATINQAIPEQSGLCRGLISELGALVAEAI